MMEQGRNVRSPIQENKGEVETTCDELTKTPISHPTAPL